MRPCPVKRRVIDSRSPAADALLDFRNPPSSPRADRLTVLENQSESFRLQLLGEREARCDREADVERLQALVPTWIPCAERLPEHFAWVLVAFCEGVVQRAFLRDDGWVLVGTNQGWVLSSHTYPLRDVTHWMPLPAPPEVPHG